MIVIQDAEANGLYIPNKNIKPTTCHCICTHVLETGEKRDWYGENLHEYADYIAQADLVVGHNLLGYDVFMLDDCLGVVVDTDKCVDTLVLSRLTDSSRVGHSVDAYGKRFNRYKPSHDDWSVFSSDMLHRCREDVEINVLIYRYLMHEMKQKDIPWSEAQSEFYSHYQLTRTWMHGFPIDIDKLDNLILELDLKQTQLHEEILETFPKKLPELSKVCTPKLKKDGTYSSVGLRDIPVDVIGGEFGHINWVDTDWNRDVLVRRLLLQRGWVPTEFTDKTKEPRINEDTLEFAAQSIPEARLIRDWKMCQKRLEHLRKWREMYNKEKGTLHCKINHIGTRTHRASHVDPPLTQVVGKDKPYGHEMRSLFRVEKGVMIGVDAQSFQMRILAEYTEDPDFIHHVVDGDIQTKVLEAINDNGNDERFVHVDRSMAKRKNYSLVMGGTVPAAMRALHVDYTLAKIAHERHMNMPGIKEVVEKYGKIARQGYIKSKCGRWYHVQVDNKYGPVWQGRWLPCLLQGDEAAIMKMAFARWSQQATHKNIPWRLLFWNHDEWQVWTTEKHCDELKQIILDSLTWAGVYYGYSVPIIGEAKVGYNWSETH